MSLKLEMTLYQQERWKLSNVKLN